MQLLVHSVVNALTFATSGLLSVGFSSVCTARTFLTGCRRVLHGATRDGSICTFGTCRDVNCVAGSLMRIAMFILYRRMQGDTQARSDSLGGGCHNKSLCAGSRTKQLPASESRVDSP